MNDGWLNVEDVVDYIGESKRTVYAMIDRGDIPASRIDGRRKFKVRKSDLEAIFDANIVAPKSRTERPKKTPKPDSFAARNVRDIRGARR